MNLLLRLARLESRCRAFLPDKRVPADSVWQGLVSFQRGEPVEDPEVSAQVEETVAALEAMNATIQLCEGARGEGEEPSTRDVLSGLRWGAPPPEEGGEL